MKPILAPELATSIFDILKKQIPESLHSQLHALADSYEALQYEMTTTYGLWATDRPDLVSDPNDVMFRIGFIGEKKPPSNYEMIVGNYKPHQRRVSFQVWSRKQPGDFSACKNRENLEGVFIQWGQFGSCQPTTMALVEDDNGHVHIVDPETIIFTDKQEVKTVEPLSTTKILLSTLELAAQWQKETEDQYRVSKQFPGAWIGSNNPGDARFIEIMTPNEHNNEWREGWYADYTGRYYAVGEKMKKEYLPEDVIWRERKPTFEEAKKAVDALAQPWPKDRGANLYGNEHEQQESIWNSGGNPPDSARIVIIRSVNGVQENEAYYAFGYWHTMEGATWVKLPFLDIFQWREK